jgi:hypothetical protein
MYFSLSIKEGALKPQLSCEIPKIKKGLGASPFPVTKNDNNSINVTVITIVLLVTPLMFLWKCFPLHFRERPVSRLKEFCTKIVEIYPIKNWHSLSVSQSTYFNRGFSGLDFYLAFFILLKKSARVS